MTSYFATLLSNLLIQTNRSACYNCLSQSVDSLLISVSSLFLCDQEGEPRRHVSMTAFFSVLNKRRGLVVYGAILIMALFSISSLLSYFEDEKKSIAKGENHVKSDHIECFMYNQGILRGKVHASMRSKVYEVTVRKLSCMFMFIFCESVGNH